MKRNRYSEKGILLYKKAKTLIPGGTQLLSKRPEMFLPENWPAYYSKADGVFTWDLDGQKYVDMSLMGVGANVLGYNNGYVNNAVKKAVDMGSMNTLNSYEEVELAERLISLHPWAEMARFSRTGGEACSIAVRIARAATGREKVAFCGYHGWHDWYLSSNLSDSSNLDGQLLPGLDPNGVPRSLKGTSLPFNYNNLRELEVILNKFPGELAAVIMEVERHSLPQGDFLQQVKKITAKTGAVLIFDEVTSGWRMNLGGLHLKYDIEPDIAVFGKALGNGYPISAVIGKKEVMESAQDSFISSTFWTERIGFTAAIATLQFMEEHDVPSHLIKIGSFIQTKWKEAAARHSLEVKVIGIPPLATFIFQHEKSAFMHTYFTQEMLKRGFIASKAVYASYKHTEAVIEDYFNNLDEVFLEISSLMKEDKIESALDGPAAHSGFKRLA